MTQPPLPPQPGPSAEELFTQNIKPIFFDYDKYDIGSDQQPRAVRRDALSEAQR